jgi:hypothetical protein
MTHHTPAHPARQHWLSASGSNYSDKVHFPDMGTTQCSLSFAHIKYNACIQIEAMTINKMNNYIIMNHINHGSDITLDTL